MVEKHRKKRVPLLKYTKLRNIGYHVSYRDPKTGTPRKHRFGMIAREQAEAEYHEWVAAHLRGETYRAKPTSPRRKLKLASRADNLDQSIAAVITPGSLLHATSGLLQFEESRVRRETGPRRQGSIDSRTFQERKAYAQEFLQFINSRYERGAVGKMQLADLTMHDVEAYNRAIVGAGYSAVQVKKRLQFAKAIIDRAGRPEHGGQVLSWNWDSRDVIHGRPPTPKSLPTLTQLKLVLKACEAREAAMVWMAVGCGLGQRDLAAVRVGQIDADSYDLRRGKTGVERYGETPAMVWTSIERYLREEKRSKGERMFVTARGTPIVYEQSDTVGRWWGKLRKSFGEQDRSLGGFYTLRHLGATEFGSRPGCSIGAMRRWLGHSASSQVADVYMKPVSPENRAIIEWVRKSLKTGKANLQIRG